MVPARLSAPPGLTQPRSCPGHVPSPMLPARSPLGQPPHSLQRQGSPCIAPRTPSQAAGTPASSFVYLLVSLQLKKKGHGETPDVLILHLAAHTAACLTTTPLLQPSSIPTALQLGQPPPRSRGTHLGTPPVPFHAVPSPGPRAAWSTWDI